MRRASLPRRLERLVHRRGSGGLERTIREVAEVYGLDPAEVRAELAHLTEQEQRSGPCTPEQAVRRCAEELGLPEDEVWDEYAWVTGAAGARR